MSNLENDKIRDYILDTISNKLVSDCCGAKISENMDICSKCMDHCYGIDAEGNKYFFGEDGWILKLTNKIYE